MAENNLVKHFQDNFKNLKKVFSHFQNCFNIKEQVSVCKEKLLASKSRLVMIPPRLGDVVEVGT